MAGKTGTTRKFDNQKREYSTTNHISSFIGFFPAEDPQLTILVILDEPQKEYLGSKGAAPVFKKIALHALRFYPETKARTNYQQNSKTTKNTLFHSTSINAGSLESIKDISSAFLGLTMREALVVADKLNVQVKINGSGSVRQVYANGSGEKSYSLILK